MYGAALGDRPRLPLLQRYSRCTDHHLRRNHFSCGALHPTPEESEGDGSGYGRLGGLSRFEPETRGLRTFENLIATVFAGEQVGVVVRSFGTHLEKADHLLYMMRDD